MSDTPWFHDWFGTDYLELYPHRDRQEAEAGVSLLLNRIPWTDDWNVLDLACGAGRHLQVLHGHGLSPVGLDLSLPLLRQARATEPLSPVVRGDMRSLPFGDEAFHLITSFFTSFGYFRSPADDETVLSEVRRTLRPGGYFFLDFLNAKEVVRALNPRDESVSGGKRVVQERRIVQEGKVVEKQIRIRDESGGEERSYTERVRLYRSHELESLLEAAGLVPVERLGDYRGGAFSDESPRCILLGRAD